MIALVLVVVVIYSVRRLLRGRTVRREARQVAQTAAPIIDSGTRFPRSPSRWVDRGGF